MKTRNKCGEIGGGEGEGSFEVDAECQSMERKES